MDREFLRRVAKLVVPMAIQNTINFGVMAADVIMIGRVGEKVLSGSSLAGQIYFILSLIMFGVSSGASVLLAQYWGKKDTVTIEKIIGIGMRIVLIAAVAFSIVTLIAPAALMRIYTSDVEVIAYGVQYLQIIAFTYPISAFVTAYLSMLRSTEKVRVSTAVYATSFVINVFANAMLIYGLWFFPKLGIRGAAIGTLIARCVEMALVLYYMKYINRKIRVRPRYVLHTEKWIRQDFWKYSGYVVFNEVLWGIGHSMMAAIIGHLGSQATAAYSVAQVTKDLASVMIFGIASATAIMIGKQIGKGDLARAEQYGHNFLHLSGIVGAIAFASILLIRPVIQFALGYTGLTRHYVDVFLVMMAVYSLFHAISITCIVGIFRAGGDARFGMILDLFGMWVVSILFGILAAFVFKWPVEVVYAILLFDEVFKMPIAYMRYRQKKWLNNVTRDTSEMSA